MYGGLPRVEPVRRVRPVYGNSPTIVTQTLNLIAGAVRMVEQIYAILKAQNSLVMFVHSSNPGIIARLVHPQFINIPGKTH